MTNYRRDRVPGATYFFTVNCAVRGHNSLLIDHISSLRAALKTVKERHPFRIDAMVILPDHVHAVWTLPEYDEDYSKRWSLIKANFSRSLPKYESVSQSRQVRGERGIWQRRFWEHRIRNQDDFNGHADYVHWNPVKHGLVSRVRDWPYSSFHRFVKRGIYSEDWAGGGDGSLYAGEVG